MTTRDPIKLKAKQKRHYESQKRRGVRKGKFAALRQKRKTDLVEYKGGKCQNCGYNKYIGALDFHHNNGDKTGELAIMLSKLVSMEKLKSEADKCILLCANCHREEHYELKRQNYGNKTRLRI